MANETYTITRRMSLEDDFMDFHTDDLLYTFLRCISTVKPEKDGKMTEYLPLTKYKKNKKFLTTILECTRPTLENKINKLKAIGLIEEGVITATVHGQTYSYPSFIFPQTGKFFKIVERDLLRRLVDTRNTHTIRVFLFLLDKYEWKPDYIFTLKEIKVALGFSENTKEADTTMKNILVSLQDEGYIKWEHITILEEHDDKVVPVTRMKLLYVAKTVQDIHKCQKN